MVWDVRPIGQTNARLLSDFAIELIHPVPPGPVYSLTYSLFLPLFAVL